MHSSDDDFVMETNGNDSSCSDFEKAISRKKRKKDIENPDSSEYIKHQNMEKTSEKFACELCSKTFKYKKGLARHVNSEHMEAEARFPCESCSKTIKYKQDFAVHIKSQSFVGIPDIEQVELIADKFAKISQEYEPLDNSTFHYSLFSSYDVTSRGPEVHPYLVYKYMTVIGLADQGHNHLKPLV